MLVQPVYKCIHRDMYIYIYVYIYIHISVRLCVQPKKSVTFLVHPVNNHGTVVVRWIVIRKKIQLMHSVINYCDSVNHFRLWITYLQHQIEIGGSFQSFVSPNLHRSTDPSTRPGISTGDPPTSTAFGSLDSELLADIGKSQIFWSLVGWCSQP